MARPDPRRAYAEPALDRSIAAAVKALAEGKATDGQQVKALEFILHRVCVVDGLSFRPDELGGERDTSFAEGRRFVGLLIRKIVMLPFDELVPKSEVKNG